MVMRDLRDPPKAKPASKGEAMKAVQGGLNIVQLVFLLIAAAALARIAYAMWEWGIWQDFFGLK